MAPSAPPGGELLQFREGLGPRGGVPNLFRSVGVGCEPGVHLLEGLFRVKVGHCEDGLVSGVSFPVPDQVHQIC